MKKIVTIGGGGGHAQILKGLRTIPDISILGICPHTDSGGSTGVLSQEYGSSGCIGDLTKCITALCPNSKLADALIHRFQGGCLDGHSAKNILFLALTQTNGLTFFDALETMMYDICQIQPHGVTPVSIDLAELCAELSSGGQIVGETNIDNLAKNPLWLANIHAIKNVRLQPTVTATTYAIASLKKADHIVICPGDLYSSIIPVLLPCGVKETIELSNAKITIVLNIMTKRGETDGYHAEDFVHIIENHMGRSCDTILYNDTPIPNDALGRYQTEEKVRLRTFALQRDPRLIRFPLVYVTQEGYVYHNPLSITRVFIKIFNNQPG
jgi:uncharacterized cofD-like protein